MMALSFDEGSVEKSCEVLKKGGLVIYPTETAYALGADAMNVRALQRLLKVKERPSGIPLLVIIADLDMIRPYAEIDERVEFLVKEFMPGPLTLAVRKKSNVPDLLNPEGISFRISSCREALILVKTYNRPLTGTSANIHGERLIYDPEKIISRFSDKVDIFLNTGILKESPPSTVLDLKCEVPRVIREGAITKERIFERLRTLEDGRGCITWN